jgi:hypothetical protein
MSWSISLVGTPEGISRQLDIYGETMGEGQSKAEFMDAKPHLQGLLSQVVKQNVRLNANGHATFEGGKRTYGAVSVSLENFYGEWCS